MNDLHWTAEGWRQACHDLRQPIAGVLALAGAALAETGLPEPVRARLGQICELAEWQSDLIEHWLGAGTPGRPGAAGADVVRVVNEAIAAEQATWPGELRLLWPAEEVSAPLHPVILRRIVANLLANATRAAGPSGSVRVEVGRRGGEMLIVVEDDGPGFGRLSGRYGLGLPAAARQVIRHRGRLECGRGTDGGGQVRLWLPLAAPRTGSRTGRRTADATRSV